jgi:hypothetical protein
LELSNWKFLSICCSIYLQQRVIHMTEPIGPLIAAIKNAGPPIYAAAMMSTLLLLFLPDTIVTEIGLLEFKQSHRLELGVTLIASTSLLTVYALFALAPFAQAEWVAWRRYRDIRKILADLTNGEKEFLRPFYC